MEASNDSNDSLLVLYEVFFFFFFFWGGGGGVLVKSYAISAKHAFKGNLKACYKVRQIVITSLQRKPMNLVIYSL